MPARQTGKPAVPRADPSAADPILEEDGEGVVFRIVVVPRSSRARFGPCVGDHLKVAVTSPPVDGKANDAVRDLIAKTFGVRRTDVVLLSGQHGRRKVVRVQGLSRARLVAALS